MSLAFLLLTGCSNLDAPAWGGGGTRYATGEAGDPSSDDTGDTGDTTYTGGPGAPELLTGAGAYQEPNEAEQVFILFGVAYTDDPDDVDGGRLYYTLWVDGAAEPAANIGIVSEDPDENTEAWLDGNGNIVFNVGPVDTTDTHAVDVYVVDYTRNRSNEITIEVTQE
jgi:hypothetical protein